MKVLTNLPHGNMHVDESWVVISTSQNSVLDEPVPGFHRLISLGPQGLFLRAQNKAAIHIPLAEILKLAEASDSGFIPPQKSVESAQSADK